MKASVFIATSLDGFIARENGDIDWLPTGDPSGSGEDYCYKPHELIERLEKRGVKHLYIDGGKAIQAFLCAGLIQQLIVTRIPHTPRQRNSIVRAARALRV